MECLNTIGIALSFIGSIILAFTLIMGKSTIDEISKTKFNGNEALRQMFLKGRRFGIWGVVFLLCGFFLQLLSNVL